MAATVYRCFDADDKLVYVGVSTRLPLRFDEHASRSAWWFDVVTIRLEHFATRVEALAAEAAAIGTERPTLNVQHAAPPRIMRRVTYEGVEYLLTQEEAADLDAWRTQPYEPFSHPSRYGTGPQPKLKPWPGWRRVLDES